MLQSPHLMRMNVAEPVGLPLNPDDSRRCTSYVDIAGFCGGTRPARRPNAGLVRSLPVPLTESLLDLLGCVACPLNAVHLRLRPLHDMVIFPLF